MKLDRVLILGATGGIGRAVAEAILPFARELILIGRNPSKCHALSRAFKRYPKVKVFSLDIREKKGADMLRQILAQSHADIVINTTGIGQIIKAEDLTQSLQQEIWDINYFIPVQITRQLMQLQREWQKPVISLQLCSLASLYPHPYLADYSATKSALLYYHMALAEELRQEKREFYPYSYVLGAVQTNFFPEEVQKKLGGSHLQMTARRAAKEIVQKINKWESYAILGKRYRLLDKILGMLPPSIRLKGMALYLKKAL